MKKFLAFVLTLAMCVAMVSFTTVNVIAENGSFDESDKEIEITMIESDDAYNQLFVSVKNSLEASAEGAMVSNIVICEIYENSKIEIYQQSESIINSLIETYMKEDKFLGIYVKEASDNSIEIYYNIEPLNIDLENFNICDCCITDVNGKMFEISRRTCPHGNPDTLGIQANYIYPIGASVPSYIPQTITYQAPSCIYMGGLYNQGIIAQTPSTYTYHFSGTLYHV